MSSTKGRAFTGLALLAIFFAVLVIMFLPIFQGHNTLEYLDELYNSISKGSAYYIPTVREESGAFEGNSIAVTLKMGKEEYAEQTALLYRGGGAEATVVGGDVTITGDLGNILANCLDDSELMYNNEGDKIKEKYGHGEKQMLYIWWKSLKELDRVLLDQKLFKEAKVVTLVKKKAVETAYNYFGVEPQKITDRLGIVVFSLVFYVVYTLWYGFAIMFLFEGLGLSLSH